MSENQLTKIAIKSASYHENYLAGASSQLVPVKSLYNHRFSFIPDISTTLQFRQLQQLNNYYSLIFTIFLDTILFGVSINKNVDPINKTVELSDTEDIENLDRRRMEVGMMPIQMYEQIMLRNLPK